MEQLNEMDDIISENCSEFNRKLVVENLETLASHDGLINTNGMWQVKRKFFPKTQSQLSVGKKNLHGHIITNSEELKSLNLETYKHRLRHRPICKDLLKLKELKEMLFERRIRLAKLRKSPQWDLFKLRKVLKNLKNNKARDPHGYVFEIFKPGVIGKDLEKSLLLLFNKIKKDIEIPKFMEDANITTIYKGKRNKLDLLNDRGIFLVSKIKSILIKMLYNETYEILDENLSDSNIGARKAMSVRNHIFIINGNINEVI